MSRFKVKVGHDWAVVECASPSVAERSVKAFFGIRGSDHETSVEETADAVGHSGQQLKDEVAVEVPILEDKVLPKTADKVVGTGSPPPGKSIVTPSDPT